MGKTFESEQDLTDADYCPEFGGHGLVVEVFTHCWKDLS